MKILLVEDHSRFARYLRNSLAELSFTVSWVRNCADACEAICETSFDCVALDLGLPDGDGLDLIRMWRSSGFTEPIIVLSARDAVQDRIDGLNVGADDYLPKPFIFEELVARIRSIMRRKATHKSTVLKHGKLTLDLLSRQALLDDNHIELTTKEFALLELLMQNSSRVLTRMQIAQSVWDSHYDIESNLIDVYVRRVRRKFEGIDGAPSIKTIRGVGYSLR